MNAITINVTDAALPITIGVPLKLEEKLKTVDRLVLRDEKGRALPVAFRVLSRWHAAATAKKQPIKWVLLDFVPTRVGKHTLSEFSETEFAAFNEAANGVTSWPSIALQNRTDEFRLSHSRLSVRIAKSGTKLLNSFMLDGVEQLKTNKPRLEISFEPASSVINTDNQSSGGGLGARAGQKQVRVNDPTIYRMGQQVRFELKARFWYHVPDAVRIKDGDFGDFKADATMPPREFVIARGTPREYTLRRFAYIYAGDQIYRVLPDDYPTDPALQPQEGDTVEDAWALAEPVHTITKIQGNLLTLDTPLQYDQLQKARLVPVGTGVQVAPLRVTKTVIEEQNALRYVIRQDGAFETPAYPHLSVSVRYYVYANQPFVRMRVRLLNATPDITVRVQDAIFEQLKFVAEVINDGKATLPPRNPVPAPAPNPLPTRGLSWWQRGLNSLPLGATVLRWMGVETSVAAITPDNGAALALANPVLANDAGGATTLLTAPPRTLPPLPQQEDSVFTHSGMGSACERILARRFNSVVGGNKLKLAVPEFAANFPSKLTAGGSEMAYHLLPKLPNGDKHRFFADWAKTWDFYLGENADQAVALTNGLAASVDSNYACATRAIRHAMIARRPWLPRDFSGNAELAEAAERSERLIACGYDINVCDDETTLGGTPRMSLYEYRLSNHTHTGNNDFGEHFGWQLFGNTRSAADSFTFNRYDMGFTFLREFVRTGSLKAFRLGSEHTRYMADGGTVQSAIAHGGNQTYSYRGLNRYERSPNVTRGQENPKPTHSWSEGLWLLWALTGDPIARETALLHRDAARRWNYQGIGVQPGTIDGSLAYNEARGPGWTALELLTAYRYDGDGNDLGRCKQYLDNLRLSEESQGKRGVYVAPGYEPADKTGTQPFIWAGYPSIALTEYLRERELMEIPDPDLTKFLIRQAQWLLLGDQPGNAPLGGGELSADGTQYLPLGCVYSWYPNGSTQGVQTSNAIANLCMVTLAVAARYAQRADFRWVADTLFKDVCFYRDWPDGLRPVTQRTLLSFRNDQFYGTCEKMWGQTAQAFSAYLPDAIANHQLQPPHLTEVSPTAMQAGESIEITLTGERFEEGCFVYWNGFQVAPLLQTPQQITVIVPADQVNGARASLCVVNPNGGQSYAQNVTIFGAGQQAAARA